MKHLLILQTLCASYFPITGNVYSMSLSSMVHSTHFWNKICNSKYLVNRLRYLEDRVDILILRYDKVGIISGINRLDSAEKGLEQIISKGYLRTFEEIKTKVQKCILADIQIHSEQSHQVSVCYISNFKLKQELPKTAYNRKKIVKSTI